MIEVSFDLISHYFPLLTLSEAIKPDLESRFAWEFGVGSFLRPKLGSPFHLIYLVYFLLEDSQFPFHSLNAGGV